MYNFLGRGGDPGLIVLSQYFRGFGVFVGIMDFNIWIF